MMMKNPIYNAWMVLFIALVSCKEDSSVVCNGNLTVSPANVEAAFCGQSTGSFSLTTSGQSGAVTYQLNNGSFQSSPDFTGLAPGTYHVTAKDDGGCTANTTVTIENQNKALNLTASATNSACGTSEGTLSVEATGGNAPYAYSLDSTSFQTETEFKGLEPGAYTVTVRDKDGCTSQTSVVVHSGITFSETISNIISTNCAVSGCHDGSQSIPNYKEKSVIFAKAQLIKDRTSAKTMPPPSSGRSLTDEEIQQIACWVNDGAPDN